MKKTIAAAFAALPVAFVATAAPAADVISRRDNVPTYQETDQRGGVRIGYLDCSIGGGVGYVLGSAKEADCVFKSTMGSEPLDRYTGVVRKMGVDLGFTTRSRLIWAVFAPTAGYHHGSLPDVIQHSGLPCQSCEAGRNCVDRSFAGRSADDGKKRLLIFRQPV